MGERLTFKQKLYKAIADAAALEHELAACLFMEITHKFQIEPGVYLRYVVTIAVRETESLFDVLTEKVAAFRHWVFLDCTALGPGWRRHNHGVTVPAEVIKPYVDDHLHTLFRIGNPTYQKIKLTHNDPRFWGLFKKNRDENRIALKVPFRSRASV
jgi:hypothetical protein